MSLPLIDSEQGFTRIEKEKLFFFIIYLFNENHQYESIVDKFFSLGAYWF